METATNLSFCYYKNGSQQSSSAIYAGYYTGVNFVGCIAFTTARPASAVQVSLTNYSFNNSSSSKKLQASISDTAGDPGYINTTGAGEAAFSFGGTSGGHSVSFTITKKLSAGTHYLYLYSGGGGIDYCRLQNSATAVSYAPILASTISSLSASVPTGGSLSLVMDKPAAANRHIASFSIGGEWKASSTVFDTSLSYTPPRSWFTGWPASDSLTVTVSVQSYEDGSCGQALGDPAVATFTLTADSGMKPVLLEGFATAVPYNTGPAAGMSGCIQGHSRMEITFDSTKIDMSATFGAEIAKFTLDSPGVSVSAAPYRSGVITGKTELKCTATDSRGRTASVTIVVEPLPWAAPSLSAVAVGRCLADGTESEDGSCYFACAGLTYSALAGENACTLTCALARATGEYGAETVLTPGERAVLGGDLSPDLSYCVRLTATDVLGGTAQAVVKLPTRTWAMKFRPDGKGVGFGMAPQEDKVLQIPADWMVMLGEKTLTELLERVKEQAKLEAHPVGSLYLSTESTDPAVLFGGTWVRIKDRFLLAAGDSYGAGGTGGEASHVLSLSEMPAHQHDTYVEYSSGSETAAQWTTYLPSGAWKQISSASGQGGMTKVRVTQYTGGWGVAHNNMPPYLTVYVWQRTA